MPVQKPHLIIVGGGIAGSAAALRAAQYQMQAVWIRGDRKTHKASRGQWVANIDNMIGVHDQIVRKKISKRLRKEHPDAATIVTDAHHEHISSRDIIDNVIERVQADYSEYVQIVDARATRATKSEDGTFVVETEAGSFSAAHLIIATGVMDRQPSIKKAKGDGTVDDVKWVYPFANRESILYCIRCEGHLTRNDKVAVIGSGEAAAQLAMMLKERYDSGAYVLTNGDAQAWSSESDALLKAYGIAVHSARLIDLQGSKGALHTIALEDGDKLEVRFALVSMGLFRVYNDLARQLGAALTNPEQPEELRHVQIDAQGRTSVPGLLAIGDMTRRADEGVMKQIYTSQEYAVRAVDVVDRERRTKMRAAIARSSS